MFRSRLFPLLVACCLAGPSGWGAAGAEEAGQRPSESAESSVLPGHSYHGEAFNEGPRQRAYLMSGTGNVSFLCTTASPEAQQFVNQGLGQLHGFWYFEAERSFRQAAVLDPNCAIAYWGMALANINNEKRAKGFIAEAMKRKEGVSPREALYIDAFNAWLKAGSKKDKERRQQYVTALEKILHEHPDDIEAKAFLALQLWQNHGKGLPIASYFAVDALLGEVFAANPMHPAHHYRIHLWDREKPERALESAARCGQAAPAIAHMWHMPGHTYSKLKRYRDAVWQQEGSARVDHAHMIRDRILPDQIHNYAHNNEWLIRNLVHIGRAGDAVALAKNMLELPRHPKHNTLGKRGSSSAYGRERLFEVLTKYERWEELLDLADTMYLEPTDVETEQDKRLRHVGRARFALGDVAKGKQVLHELEERLKTHCAEEQRAVAKAVAVAGNKARAKLAYAGAAAGKDADSVMAPSAAEVEAAYAKTDEQITALFPDEIKKARANGAKPFAERKKGLEQAISELQGRAAVAAGDHTAGLELLKKAKLDALLLAPAQVLAGDGEQAEKALAKEVDSHENEVLPLAHLVHVRWQLGNEDAAKEAFRKLREIGSDADLDAAPLARLAPIAVELGYPFDWRIPREPPEDVGERPELDALGPLRWRPSPAPNWTLADRRGAEHSLSDYRGTPVVVIFYLGYGCLHCAEQLKAFAPKAGEFADAGLSVVAISTDRQESLQKAVENYDGDFPFPLLSDSAFETFRNYRAFDDFEQQPLHGTFLIDGEGLIRWQDLGHEPFMDPDFVLAEAKRQLMRTPPPTATTKAVSDTDHSPIQSDDSTPSASLHTYSRPQTQFRPAGPSGTMERRR